MYEIFKQQVLSTEWQYLMLLMFGLFIVYVLVGMGKRK